MGFTQNMEKTQRERKRLTLKFSGFQKSQQIFLYSFKDMCINFRNRRRKGKGERERQTDR